MRFESTVIKLNNIPCVCPYCSAVFTYNLKENRSVLVEKRLEYAVKVA